MTPAARVQTAIEVLDIILAGEPAEKALTGWARRSRYAGSKDRAAVRDHVFDVLRRKRSLAEIGGGSDGRALMIGLLRTQTDDPEALFTGPPYGPSELSDAERAVLSTAKTSDLWDVPAWLETPLRASLGLDAASCVAALADRAPVFLRVNLRKSTRDDAIQALVLDGIVAEPHATIATALRVTQGPRKVARSIAYLDGEVELQDASSQAAVNDLDIPEGARILDYCAGGGGKVLAIAAQTRGTYFAYDTNATRMRDLPLRATRASIAVTVLDADTLQSEAPYDVVYCDVPCSGSGTWRRAPDAKWRFEPQDLSELTQTQDQILTDASALVASGGQLIYSTCSILQEENQERIEAFVARHPEWSVQSTRQWQPNSQGDGFFLSQLQRT